jgi:signal peptidase II
MKKTALFTAAGAAFLVIPDQVTKWLALIYLQSPLEIMPWFKLGYQENTGIAWSIQIPYLLLLALNFGLVILFFYFTGKYLDISHRLTQIAVALIFAGACGNIVDRLVHGYVIDFISVWIWPVFNLADAFLTVGIFLILLFYAKIRRN